MRKKNAIDLERVSIKLEHNVKEWYTDKSAVYGMPMAVLMQYVLTTYYETQLSNDAVRNLSALNSDGDMSTVSKNLAEIFTQLTSLQLSREDRKIIDKNTEKK